MSAFAQFTNFTAEHEDIPSFGLRLKGVVEVIDCFMAMLIPASIQTHGLHLMHDMFTMQSTVLYNFQHSLALTKVPSLATKTADIMAIFFVTLILR
jgi:hypothetical protein